MIKQILTYPKDKDILTQKSEKVTEFTDEIKEIIQDLKDTVIARHGAEISAIQIGKPYQICVVNWDGIHVLVNPEITRSRGIHEMREGCLSVPGLFVDTKRAQKVWISALDENGQIIEYAQGGNGSYIVQHELDHFNGECTLFKEYDRENEAKNNDKQNNE